MVTHRHRRNPELDGPTRAYDGCISPGRCEPHAHGGVRYVVYCNCGAEQLLNVSYGHVERSGWDEPEGE